MSQSTTKELSVYLHDSSVGHLAQDKHGRISFSYSPAWLEQSHCMPLSQSLPLREEPFEGKECQGFFAGVLPEEENRRIIAAILGISSHNDFALLEQIGGECAGAVTFLPAGQPLPPQAPAYQALSNSDLAEILRELPTRPLMAGHKDVRLSLAGAQNKLAIHIDDHGNISLPLQNAPSTHILKPTIPGFEGIVENEAFCMNLARKAGLPTARVSTASTEGTAYLLTERYDRHLTTDGKLRRLHQEDFCQALGLPPQLKYQNEGGPTLKQCFSLIRDVSNTPAPDLLTLLDATTFNFLIGNNDAHGKNFSFLYETPGASGTRQVRARLAPLYDLLSTTIYPKLSPKMAMKIGSKYLPGQVRIRHWQTLWHDAGFSENAARKRTIQFARKVTRILSDSPVKNDTQQAIAHGAISRAQRLTATLSPS